MSVISRTILAGVVCASLVSVQGARAAPATGDQAATSAGDNGASSDTRGRLLHATKCLTTLGFGGGCDKDAPEAKIREARAAKAKEESAAKGADRAVVADAAPDTSPRARLLHATKCVTTMGFGGGCDKDAPYARASRAAAPDTSTRGRLAHAAKCVTTMGFAPGCDKEK